jgi:aldehyde dehydrogenase (NAD+)
MLTNPGFTLMTPSLSTDLLLSPDQASPATARPLAAQDIPGLVQRQREFFQTGQTQSLEFRLDQLKRLKQAVLDREHEILAAVRQDLGRHEFEGYFELATLSDLNLAIKSLKRWCKPQRVPVSVDVWPGSAYIEPQPLGVVLIIGPWNYPFQLVFGPLVGALAAGNCAIVKPSELAPHTSQVVANLIEATFAPKYVAVLQGDATVAQGLLAEKFDHIFFTGGTQVGRRVMQAAAAHLTPVTLELGGKSPCIVDADVNLKIAAQRIAWGKWINNGQTCIAPDYVLVNRRIEAEFLQALKQAIAGLYGSDPSQSPDYGRIVSPGHWQRLVNLIDPLEPEQIALGGQRDAQTRYVAPTVLTGLNWDVAVMQEEIFGPILPVLPYDDLNEAISQINQRPKPLALYVFSSNSQVQQQVLAGTTSGNACINDTVLQVGVQSLPFGGVGDSGMGCYHGKFSFDTFSHRRAVLKRGLRFDLPWRYAPYTPERVKQIKGIVMR